MEPLLTVSDLRVDVGGVPACDGIGFRTNGQRVLVLGAPKALFDAVIGQRPIARGAVTVRGRIAGAPASVPTPNWTVREYLEWSARLGGVPNAEAKASAMMALERMKLGALAKTPMPRLLPHARRAAIVGAALATYAEVIALSDPFGGLTDEAANTFAEILVEALADRSWLCFAPRMPLGSPLAAASDEAIVLAGSRVEGQGAPQELATSSSFTVRLSGERERVCDALCARGASIQDFGTHFVLDLGSQLTTVDFFSICAEHENVAVLELVPLAHAFR